MESRFASWFLNLLNVLNYYSERAVSRALWPTALALFETGTANDACVHRFYGSSYLHKIPQAAIDSGSRTLVELQLRWIKKRDTRCANLNLLQLSPNALASPEKKPVK